MGDYYPPEWDDDERMRVLFAPITNSQDSVSRNSRMTFWSAAIHLWCKKTHTLIFSLQDTLVAFRRGTRQPQCLPDILQYCLEKGEVATIEQYEDQKKSVSWKGWGMQVLVARPSRWALSTVKHVLGMDSQSTLINTTILQVLCDDVCGRIWQESEVFIYTFHELFTQMRDLCGTPDNLQLIISHLAHCGRVATKEMSSTTYIKFIRAGETQNPTLTTTDLAQKELKLSQIQLESRIAELGNEISQLQVQARTAVKENVRFKALSALRRKKRMEKSIEVTMKSLENVTACLLQLQETELNRNVLLAFKTGAEALKESMAGDLSQEGVERTMDHIQQVLEECSDVSDTLASSVSTEDMDETVFEEELQELINSKIEIPKQDEDMTLPNPPKEEPVTSAMKIQETLQAYRI